jgi:hypothetical protein
MTIFRDILCMNCSRLHTKRICGIEIFPLGHGGWKRARVFGVTQQVPTSQRLTQFCSLRDSDSLTVVVFLPLLSLREGRNPTLTMANQSTTRPSNPSTPKRVAKSASSQSLNHLLNFSLPPRQTHQVQSLPRRSRRHGTTQGVWNKEREAVFRFRPRAMITIHPLFRLC